MHHHVTGLGKASRAGGRAPRTLQLGGLMYAQGLMLGVKKISSLKKYSKYEINKHVDKSISFHYCTVIWTYCGL